MSTPNRETISSPNASVDGVNLFLQATTQAELEHERFRSASAAYLAAEETAKKEVLAVQVALPP